MVYSDKSKYEGRWENDKRHGNGTMVFANCDKYVGEYQNDIITGKGIIQLM